MDDERGDSEGAKVGPEVSSAKGVDAIDRCLGACHDRQHERPVEQRAADGLGNKADAVEGFGEGLEKSETVFAHLRLHLVQCRFIDTVGIAVVLQKIRHDRADQRYPVHLRRPMARQVSRDFAASHGESDEGDFGRAHLINDCGEIVCEHVIIIAIGGMTRLPETATIIGDYAIARLQQRKRLIFPHVAGQGPAVDQDHRMARPHVLHMDDMTFGGFDMHGSHS